MKGLARLGLVATGLIGVAAFSAGVALVRHGVSARDEPTAVEVALARAMRHLAVPGSERDARNPVLPTAEVLQRARGHFADHCASCHSNDGRGGTTMGQRLYPKAPDMWGSDTQSLSDGELFYIIENGIRLTGMPAWGEAGEHDRTQSWELVHFIRHLPKLTPGELDEMQSLNPKSRKEFEEEEQMRKFLGGGDVTPAPAAGSHDH